MRVGVSLLAIKHHSSSGWEAAIAGTPAPTEED